MVNAENISVPTALSGGGRCARIMRETFLSGPYINDAAEYVSVEALPGRPIEATISLRIRRAIASYTLVLVFLVETHARFGLIHKYPRFIDVAESRRAGSNEKLRRARGQGLPTSARHETQ